MTILALEPSASVTPPCWLTTSAAASSAASLLIPNERTTPDLAPKPAILTVLSCAPAPTTKSKAENATSSPMAEASFFMSRPPVIRAGKVAEESERAESTPLSSRLSMARTPTKILLPKRRAGGVAFANFVALNELILAHYSPAYAGAVEELLRLLKLPGNPADVSLLRVPVVLGVREGTFDGQALQTRSVGEIMRNVGSTIEGPAMIEDHDAITLVLPGWTAAVDEDANL